MNAFHLTLSLYVLVVSSLPHSKYMHIRLILDFKLSLFMSVFITSIEYPPGCSPPEGRVISVSYDRCILGWFLSPQICFVVFHFDWTIQTSGVEGYSLQAGAECAVCPSKQSATVLQCVLVQLPLCNMRPHSSVRLSFLMLDCCVMAVYMVYQDYLKTGTCDSTTEFVMSCMI